MRSIIERTPVTYIAYMLILAGFAFLGVFTFTLANQHPIALVTGIGTALSFAGAIGGYYLRRYQIQHPLREDSPLLSVDLLTPPEYDSEVEQYLINYRPADRPS
ncbi:UNVERIFIED_CONTAM: hypothetical protein DES50_11084 [Williamsia faeni]